MFFMVRVYDTIYDGIITDYFYQNEENAKKKFYEVLTDFNNETNDKPEDYGFDNWESFNNSCWEDGELEQVVKCYKVTFDD